MPYLESDIMSSPGEVTAHIYLRGEAEPYVTPTALFSVFAHETDAPSRPLIVPLWARISLAVGGVLLFVSGLIAVAVGVSL